MSKSALDRDQLIAEMVGGRSASFQRYCNGDEIDFRTGHPGTFGRHTTDFQDMQAVSRPKAEIRAYAEECADRIIEQDEELLAVQAAGPRPRGRPAKPAEEQRQHYGVYFTPAERAALDAVLGPDEDFSGAMREAARLLIAARLRS